MGVLNRLRAPLSGRCRYWGECPHYSSGSYPCAHDEGKDYSGLYMAVKRGEVALDGLLDELGGSIVEDSPL